MEEIFGPIILYFDYIALFIILTMFTSLLVIGVAPRKISNIVDKIFKRTLKILLFNNWKF